MSEKSDYTKKLKYMLYMFEAYIEDLIAEVLDDDKSDPHYSAVAVNNCILSLLSVKKQNNIKCEYDDITSFLLFHGFTMKEVEAFEYSRKKESEYYEGTQF